MQDKTEYYRAYRAKHRVRLREQRRQYFRDNPAAARALRARQVRYHSTRQELHAMLKDAPCRDCHQSFPTECMDFDHVRSIKKNKIAVYTTYNAALIEELGKCVLVCANCHRIRTRERANEMSPKILR